MENNQKPRELLIAVMEIERDAPIETSDSTSGIRSRVSTQRYREGWDGVFGGSKKSTDKVLN
jgi:hypothetical protein